MIINKNNNKINLDMNENLIHESMNAAGALIDLSCINRNS